MPIDLQHAEAMLKEEECPFTREHLESCKEKGGQVLFTWCGIDMYLTLPLRAESTKHPKIPRPSFNKRK